VPIFRATYRLVKCTFCKGKGGPSWHMDEPGHMIIGPCRACNGLMYKDIAYLIHYPAHKFPDCVPYAMVQFPTSIALANPRNYGSAACLELGQITRKAFDEQLSLKAFQKAQRAFNELKQSS